MEITVGQKFGDLTFVKEVPSHIKGHRTYETLCSCGNTHIATRNNLLRSISTRCVICAKAARFKTNNKYDTEKYKYTYTSYRSMLRRCSDFKSYENVSVCDGWKCNDGFLNFLSEMGERPPNCTLDRIDNSKGYEKSNCRWATASVQNHNKRKRIGVNTSDFIGVCFSRDIWIVQIITPCGKITERVDDEIDAATLYDNYSEHYYGDRPNGTIKRYVKPKVIKKGGISLDKRTKRFRVRITIDNVRKTIGYYDTKEEAEGVLSASI